MTLPSHKKTRAEINTLTFEQVDKERGFTPQWDTPPHTSWFDEWYSGIYHTPFAELADNDLIRICQQTWNKEYFVPVALARLAIRPFVDGFLDDGGLLVAVGTDTPAEFWHENPALLQEFCHILNGALYLLSTEAAHNGDDCTVFDDGMYIYDETFAQLINVQKALSCHQSPLDLPGIELGLTAEEIVTAVREGRERP